MTYQPQGKRERREILVPIIVSLVTTLIVEGVPRLMDYCAERQSKKAKRKRKKK